MNRALDAVERRLKAVLAAVLAAEGTEVSADQLDAGFVDLGVNSLLSVEVVDRANADLGLDLGVEVVFDHPDVRELAQFVLAEHGDRLGDLLGRNGTDVEETEETEDIGETADVEEAEEADDAGLAHAAPTAGQAAAGDIAVIGMSGRFPGARDLDELWDLLREGRSAVREIDRPGWPLEAFYDPDPQRPDRSISKWAGLLDDHDRFDPRFFGISPAEAEHMDPQQRLFLEESYRAFEDGGIAVDALAGRRVGVYVGARGSDYLDRAVRAGGAGAQVFLGTDMAILAARISYALNLTGPSLTIDTACSASLVAIHLACDSIRRGESELALAGGVFVLTSPEFQVLTSKMNMLSPDGRCKTFDDDADGIVIGEGVGVVVLKSLAAALADGDHIHGVIKGSAMNQDGRTKGITAPSSRSQRALLHQAYAAAGVAPDTIGYVEAHGTGTKLGDPIEVRALTDAFREHTDRTGYCALGSHKGNLGHSIMSAGVAGLLKVLLALRHREIPPTLHVRRLNRHLDLAGSPFRVNTELRNWEPSADHPRRAGVSAFAFSGTNCHVVVEEAPARAETSGAPEAAYPVPLSARTPEALRRQVTRLADRLTRDAGELRLQDVAATLALGRTHLPHRHAVVAHSMDELVRALRTLEAGSEPAESTPSGDADALVRAYRRGDDVDWTSWWQGKPHRRVPLPAYPFHGERYWLAPTTVTDADADADETGERGRPGADGSDSVLLLAPAWHDWPQDTAPDDTERLVVLDERLPAVPGLSFLRLTGRYEDDAVRLLDELRSRAPGPLFVQLAVTDGALSAGLLGLLLTAGREYPGIRGQEVALRADAGAQEVRRLLDRARRLSGATRVRADRAGLRGARWAELAAPQPAAPWRTGGVYLITGGAGGLGRLLVADIARHTDGATVVLTGRSPAAPVPAADGVRVEYRQADVTDQAATARLVAEVLAEHGRIDGVVHAAGVLRDGYLATKTAADAAAVLAPKVAGARHLDEATQDLPLDFFVLFSSVTGALGNVGQADYAAANGFLARFADRRAEQVARGERRGRTVAIDWPLWADGGMGVDAATLAALNRSHGLEPMTTRAGLRALHGALAAGHSQVLVVAGEPDRLRALLTAPAGHSPRRPRGLRAGAVRPQLRAELAELAAALLRVRPAELDADTELHDYGFDSLTLTEFTNRINTRYDIGLTPPVLFEHSTLGRLAAYLGTTYPELANGPEAPAGPTDPPTPVPAPVRIVAPPVPAAADDPVAIVGISGVFPKAPDVQALWDNLLAGRDCIEAGLPDRWGERADAAFPWAGLIDGVAEFDPAFFGISPHEAIRMDPQQRLLLQSVWAAIEDSGHAPTSLAGSDTGVFIGTLDSGYGLLGDPDADVEGHTAVGRIPSLGPNRLSYLLDLRGPSQPIETACSSSLVALHRAVTAIRSGECSAAVAGGVNLLIEPSLHTSLGRSGALSPSGRCRTFAADADGFVRGEGAGMVLLKPLSRAEQDGDHIYGLIRATGENHGGRAQSLTAPNPRAQADLLVKVYRQAGFDPRTVGYIETHGTGTRLGDPIEINGLKAAFEELHADGDGHHSPAGSIALGSVKTNIGHLELAAGIAGVIKVLLQLRHGTLAPSLHATPANPYIDLNGSPFRVVEKAEPWPVPTGPAGEPLPRRAGVSSFSIGGSNAHVVLEEYLPVRRDTPPAEDPALVVLSARTDERLHEQARNLLEFVRAGHVPEQDLAALAYTLQEGRDAMESRLAVAVRTVAELADQLERFLDGRPGEWHQARTAEHQDVVALFAEDDDLRDTARIWMERGRFATLLQWWVKGLDVDWRPLHPQGTPRRLSLPTYPFAKERHWRPGIRLPRPDQATALRDQAPAGPEQATAQPDQAARQQPGEAADPAARSALPAVQRHLLKVVRRRSFAPLAGTNETER
ncbi:SDR family NAD(P)-dependent oxidoreductase [Streptomyces sp. NBC_01235]|uniref:SDR family NAD(P)-dependent oxidoreductase n=1 Tax=Streptomyces sp. NBC_01235 TaxID=2903788 RepID=UPI002E119CA3|nr:SDR family NAD(P)-dependent oxidoreductase [Streptomyces sp. NBC_01235]